MWVGLAPEPAISGACRAFCDGIGHLLGGRLLLPVLHRVPGKPVLDQLKSDVVPIKAADSANLAAVFGVCLVAVDGRSLR